MEDILSSLQELWSGMMTWPEYDRLVKAGELADHRGFSGLMKLDEPGLDHPLAGDRRGPRIGIADRVRDAARERSDPFPAEVLALIHQCLLDCVAAVRSSLVQALFHAGDETSVPALSELVRLESLPEICRSSKAGLRYAKAALGQCVGRGDVRFPQGKPILLCISDDFELVSQIVTLAESRGLYLHQSHSALDLVGLTSVAQVVDLALCREEDLEALRVYLQDCQPEQPDETPLILTNCRAEPGGIGADIAKPEGTVQRFGMGCANLVLGAIEEATLTS